MSGNEGHGTKKTLASVSERSTVLWWQVMFWVPDNAVATRFFNSRGTTGSTINATEGDYNNSSTPLVTNIPHDIELVAKMGDPEGEVMELPSENTMIREFKCIGWRATGDCSPNGQRMPENDLNCSTLIPKTVSGYCEIEDTNSHERFRVMKRTCSTIKGGVVLRCSDAPGFANFRARAQVAVSLTRETGFSLPNIEVNAQTPTRGIVMVVYPALVASAYATIRLLRDVLGCKLPVEIWFSPDEMKKNPGSFTPLRTLGNKTGNITFREINTNGEPIRFESKIFAIYNSGFEQVLFLDADNAPVRDPSFLFETPEFVKMGAIFWPDYWHPKNTMFYINPDSLLWQLLDMPFIDMFEQESGQL
ncbi:hypothetical protein PHMEG_00039786, partial [Phytophthora megakarya]